MKACFPVVKEEGMKSTVNEHFGSTKKFIVCDTDDDSFDVLTNKDAEHQPGMCHPLKALDGVHVDAVVLGGIGLGALRKLNALGICVYKAVKKSVGENLEAIKNNELAEMTTDIACQGHGDCDHH